MAKGQGSVNETLCASDGGDQDRLAAGRKVENSGMVPTKRTTRIIANDNLQDEALALAA